MRWSRAREDRLGHAGMRHRHIVNCGEILFVHPLLPLHWAGLSKLVSVGYFRSRFPFPIPRDSSEHGEYSWPADMGRLVEVAITPS